MRRLFNECPEQSDALKGLSQSHFVSHDASILILDHHPCSTPVKKLGDWVSYKAQPEDGPLTLTPST